MSQEEIWAIVNQVTAKKEKELAEFEIKIASKISSFLFEKNPHSIKEIWNNGTEEEKAYIINTKNHRVMVGDGNWVSFNGEKYTPFNPYAKVNEIGLYPVELQTEILQYKKEKHELSSKTTELYRLLKQLNTKSKILKVFPEFKEYFVEKNKDVQLIQTSNQLVNYFKDEKND